MKMLTQKIQQKIENLMTSWLIGSTTVEHLSSSRSRKLVIPSHTIDTSETREMPSFAPILRRFEGETYTNPDIYTTILKGVLYCPDHEILLTKSRKIVIDSDLFRRQMSEEFKFSNLAQMKVERISGWCSLFRNRRTFAHSLLDNIPRCYILDQPEYRDLEQIKLLCANRITNIENFFIPKLVPPNVTLNPVPSGRLYYIENLIFPDFLSQGGCGYLPPPFIEKIKADLLPKRQRNKNKRIFISRIKCASAAKRHILNESELFIELNTLGFEKYHLEDMSISEQIELFYDADIVVAPHGAGLSNILFSEKVKVLELHPINHNIRPFFYYLSKSLQHEHYFWYGNETEFLTNFQVDVPEILALLSNIL